MKTYVDTHEDTVRPLCYNAFYVSCQVFVHTSFLQNTKLENPGKVSWNAPIMIQEEVSYPD